jgi:hypothetical protein
MRRPVAACHTRQVWYDLRPYVMATITRNA